MDSHIVCPIKTIRRYDSLPTLAAKYTGAQNVLTVTKRAERAQSIVIIKHKYMMLMCNHKIRINIMRRLRNSTVGREIGLWSLVLVIGISIGHWSIGQIGQRQPHILSLMLVIVLHES